MRHLLRRLFLRMPRPLQHFVAARYLARKRRSIRRRTQPEALTYFVTQRCNCRCTHCFYWRELGASAEELSTDEVRRIAASMGDLPSLSLTGGEPTLRDDLAELARAFVREAGTRTLGLATNGLLRERVLDFCRALLDEKIESIEVQVSLDGLAETHDRIRGVPGAYQRALETLDAVHALSAEDRRVHGHAAFTIQRANLHELRPFIAEMRSRGVDTTFGIVRGSDFGTFRVPPEASSEVGPKDASSTEPTLEELERAVNLLVEQSRALQPTLLSPLQERKLLVSLEILRGKPLDVPCSAGWIEGVLYAEGDVALCELSKPVGNVRVSGLSFPAVWNSPAAHAMRRKLSRCFCTHGCNITTMLRLDPQIFLSELRAKALE